MASSFTGDLRLELMAAGEKDNTWGDVLNSGVFQLLEDALTAETPVSTTGGTTVLTSNNGSTDTSRNVFIDVSGTLVSNATIQIPAANKFYLVRNGTSGAFSVTFKTSGGTGIAIVQGDTAILYCDATDTFAIGTSGSYSISAFARTYLDETTAANTRSVLGLAIGTDVLPELAVVSQAVAEAGTDTAEYIWTAQRVKQAIDALSVGAGDVSGPASATSLSLAMFSGTTGKLLQDGPALGTSGQILTSNGPSLAPSFETNTAAAQGLASMQVYSASATWTKPAGVTKVLVYCCGGGGGGGGGSTKTGLAPQPSGTGGTGGGGGIAHSFIDVSAIATSTITRGAGGAGGAAAGGTGVAGGNGGTGGLSRWADGTNTITGNGGGGGTGGTSAGGNGNVGSAGGATGGSVNWPGGTGAQAGGSPALGYGMGLGSGFGSGNSGGGNNLNAGLAGSAGLVIVYEYK